MLYVIGFELLDREYRESNATYLTFPGVLSRTRDMFLEAVLSTPVRYTPLHLCCTAEPEYVRTFWCRCFPQPDPAGPFATVLRVAQDLCSPLAGAVMDRLKLERDRAAATATAAVAAPTIHADSSALDQRDEKLITLRVENSDGLAEEGKDVVRHVMSDVGKEM